MPDEWGGISIDEDEFGGIAVDEEEDIPVRGWDETAPVIRNAVPGSLTPPDLVPAVRKVGGELAIGEPGDTHPDIIDRDKIPAKDIDQRGFVGPWDEFYDRESAAKATQLPTGLEPGRLHSTDLIKATEDSTLRPFPLFSEGLPPTSPDLAVPLEPGAMEKKFQQIAEKEGPQPLLKLPSMSPEVRRIAALNQGPVAESVVETLYDAAKSVPEFFSTEEGMLAGLASMTPLGRLGVEAYFTYDMAKTLLDQAKTAGADWDTLTAPQKAAQITQAAVNLGFVGLLAKAGIGTTKKAIQAPESLARPTWAELPPNTPTPIKRPEGIPPAPTVPSAVPEVVTPEAIASKLGLRYRGTMRGIDQYVYDEPSPKTGAPSGITVSVPKGTDESGVSAKMTSRLAEYEINPPTKTAVPTLPTAEELLKASPEKIAEIRSVQGEELTTKLASEMTEAQLKEAEGIIVEYLKQHAKAKQDVEAGRITPQDFVNIVMERNKGKFLVDVFAHLRRPLPEIPKTSVEAAPVAERAKVPEETGLGLPAPSKGTVRVYSGGMGSSWYSTNLSRANEFAKAAGGAIRYVDVPREVFDKGAITARKEGSFTPGDAVLPNEWVNRSSDLRADLKKKSGKIKTLPTPEPSKAPEYVPSPVSAEPTPGEVLPKEDIFSKLGKATTEEKAQIAAQLSMRPIGSWTEDMMWAVMDIRNDVTIQHNFPVVWNVLYDRWANEIRFRNGERVFNTWSGEYPESIQAIARGESPKDAGKTTTQLLAEPSKESTPTAPPAVSEKAMGAAVPDLSVGPGASSPAEFTQRQAGANRSPPPPNPPVTIEPGQSAAPEVVRQSKDYNLFNRINSGQWLFYFGRLGEAAKQAFEKSALAEYFMRESVMRDVRTFVRGTLKELPRSARKQGGKAFFDVLDGKTMDQIRSEWEGRLNGEAIIAQAEKVKTRLEEIRTTIRDTKRDSFNRYLNAMNKDALVDLFRENINREIDIANMTKEDLANALTMDQFPDDWGISDGSYLPHLFFGQWKVTARMPGTEGSQFVTRSQTIQEAKARIYEQTRANPELRNAQFTIEQDTIVPADMIRLGDRRFWALVSKMREQNMTQAEVRDALRGNIGRKAGKEKWFGSLKERKGFEGYSKDYARTMTAYLNGFHRWKVLTQLNREVQPLIEQVRREGRINAAQRLEQLVDNLWGKPQASTKQFDAFVRQIPGVRDFIKPMALDRWARAATNLTGLLTLRTLRFSVVNRLQPLQTLYPLIGERGIIEAKVMQHTARGRELLREAGVDLDPGQYAGEFGRGLRGREFTERFSGERSNQEVAFLGMYNHARKMGMSHQDAINYGKLRGQLMTQFTPLTVDTPELFEGPFGRLMFQYKRFPVKTIELASRMAADRNVPAIARMVGVLATLGGISYFLRQTWFTDPDTRLRIKRGLDKELGTKAADTMMYGLPGFLGADISGSITLGDEPIGRGIYEKGARALTGPAVSLGIEAGRVLTTPKRKETTGIQQTETFLRRFPATRPLAELSAMLRGDIDIRTPDGETKLKRKLTDAIAGLGSFRSANEANIALAVNGIMELAKEEARLKNDYFVAPNKTEALNQILNFNRMWPEAAITPEDLDRYSKYRTTSAKQTDVSRIAGKRFERLIPQEQRIPR